MTQDYVPIPCIDHERLEFAVLRKQRLALQWRDEAGQCCSEPVMPVDVATREGAEWLSVRTADGRQWIIRLDRILTIGQAT